MNKEYNDTAENVENSVNGLYAALLEKRKYDNDEKLLQKEIAKQQKSMLKKEGEYKNKKEKKSDRLNELLIGLGADDIKYVKPKKDKKKYKRWIDDDNLVEVMDKKDKKVKKTNYNKQFAPELTMLQNLVSDQNKFTNELYKRYVNTAGPNNKENGQLNKTMLELVTNITSSRSTSLGLIKEISTIKKNISELYIKQAKENSSQNGGSDNVMEDLGIRGSNLASALFGNTQAQPQHPIDTINTGNQIPMNSVLVASKVKTQPDEHISEYDPSSWTDDSIDVSAAKAESTPHEIVVEFNSDTGVAKYKAVDPSSGDSLDSIPLPLSEIKTIDAENNFAKDSLDTIYKLNKI